MKYSNILSAVSSAEWAILPEKLEIIKAILAERAAGGIVETAANFPQPRTVSQAGTGHGGSIAILSLFGVIVPRGNMIAQSSGATSCQQFSRLFQDAVQDGGVSHIVIDIDSPGGAVDGVQELAAEIYEAREAKPIIAVCNTLAASAAYWIGSAAGTIYATPSGTVGSIGVITSHEDLSKLHEDAGVKVSYISAGKYKAEGNPHEPLSDEAREAIQKRVDQIYETFTMDVALHRGALIEQVQNGYGEARAVSSVEALNLGMIDGIKTMDAVISEILSSKADTDRRQRRARSMNRR